MRAPGSDSVPVWAWPVLLVTALHLLTTSGGWWVTDHGEILAVADHIGLDRRGMGRDELRGADPFNPDLGTPRVVVQLPGEAVEIHGPGLGW